MLKTITIDKFDGGRTNFLEQSTIDPNMCSSASMNVWAPENGLTKTPGQLVGASFTASAARTFDWFYADDTVSTNYQLFYRISVTATGSGVTRDFLYGSSTTLTDSLTPLGYNVGTVTVSGVSATGSGTAWLANVSANDGARFNSLPGGIYLVRSVEDDTHLTLAVAVSTNVPGGTSYTISPTLLYPNVAAASLNGYLANVTTGDNMQLYNGSTTSRVVGPSPAFLVNYKNYMFGARSSKAQSRLYWSAIKDPTTWPANNFIDVDVQNGKITGLFAAGQELLVFKTRGIYKILGDVFDPSNPTYTVIKIPTPSDFIFNSNYSCALFTINPQYTNAGIANTAVLFYAFGRFYKYIPGTMYITDISRSFIRDLPTAFQPYGDSMNNTDQQIRGIVFNNYYIVVGLTDPVTGNADAGVGFLLDQNLACWKLKNQNSTGGSGPFTGNSGLIVIPNATSRPQLAVGSTLAVLTWDVIGPNFTTNYVDSTIGTGPEVNAAIDGIWVSKEFNIEYGTFKWIIVYLKKQSSGGGANNLTVQWSIDQAAQVSYTVDQTMGRGNIIRAVIPINQKGSTIQLTISNNVASQTFKIYGIKIIYEESQLERLL